MASLLARWLPRGPLAIILNESTEPTQFEDKNLRLIKLRIKMR